MNTQFAKFLQIGIIVEDVDVATKRWNDEYGMGPWKILDIDSENFEDFQINGQPGKLHMRNAFCDAYGFEIELIQPISDSPYKEWLKEHGPGIHHIAVITRDPFDKVIEEHKKLTGKDPWIWCKEPSIGMEFAYLDLVKELGLFVEVYNEEKTGGLDA